MNMDMKHNNSPFKAGQLVEARSFVSGYRGSWFRCKVREISWQKGSIGCTLEYIDFPDEKIKWTKLYQKPPVSKRRMKGMHKELVVRPCYPPIYQEDEINDSRKIPEVAVIVANDWTVGDLVDWLADDVYWCGEVTQLLDGVNAKIKLPDPPIGEGQTYDVQFKDLRPTLLWSPVQGWTAPINQVDGNRRCCGRLIQPTIRGEQTTLQGQNDAQMSIAEFNASPSSLASPTSLLPAHMSEHHPDNPSQNQKQNKCNSVEACHGKQASIGFDYCSTVKPNHSDSVASPLFRVTSDDVLKADDSKEIEDGGTRKRMKIGEVNCTIQRSDTIEALVLEMEELACKVRWLKMVLDHGFQMLNTQPSWKFVENRVTAAPKICICGEH